MQVPNLLIGLPRLAIFGLSFAVCALGILIVPLIYFVVKGQSLRLARTFLALYALPTLLMALVSIHASIVTQEFRLYGSVAGACLVSIYVNVVLWTKYPDK